MAQPAPSWNAEATDAKGYWVATPLTAERVDVDWSELDSTSEASIEVPEAPAAEPAREQREEPVARLPVAPALQAALPVPDDGFEVPEFTLSEKKRRSEETPEVLRSRWEILDTYVPDHVDEAPTEEVARPPATNVKVFARSKAFTEAITQPVPGARSAGVSIEGARPSTRDTSAEVSGSLGPVARVQIEEPVPEHLPQPTATERAHEAADAPSLEVAPQPAPPADELSLDAKRALARAMAAKALSQRNPAMGLGPGSLPPVEALEELGAGQVVLPPRSQESWSWDEADPLATPHLTPTPAPRGPSLSLVRTAETDGADEGYEDHLASPLPSPPRPDVVVPWPLPVVRSRLGEPVAQPQLAAIDAMDSVSIEHASEPVAVAEVPTAPARAESDGTLGTWLAVGVCVLGVGAAGVASLLMVSVMGVLAVLA